MIKTKHDIVKLIIEAKIVSIIRLKNSNSIYQIGEALQKGGIKVIEVTLTTPNAIFEMEKLKRLSKILIGIGSVTDGKSAEQAINAGAEFIVTPVIKKEVIDVAHNYNRPVLAGAFSPTEILQAHEWGADIIKLFPAEPLGLAYYRSIIAPLPKLKLMPTGGITTQNAEKWLKSGAACLGVGNSLVNDRLVDGGEFSEITKIAKVFSSIVS